MTGPHRFGFIVAGRSVRGENRRECDEGGHCLDQQDATACGGGAVDARDRDAGEEENARLVAHGAGGERCPEEPGGEESVVKALVSGESLGGLGELRRGAEGVAGPWRGPQEHL